ncbi:MAG: hypothetical protein NC253_14120 [Ruminococcus sp.]|nr:hypothetical protein [Ruminococcus sp.]
MKKARNITLALCIAATAVFSGFFNIMGAIAILIQDFSQSAVGDYSFCGTALLISSAFLIAATVLAALQKVWLPLVFNVIGTGFYIYTVKTFYAIPNELISKENTLPFAERHLMTVFVTVLLALLIIFNYFSEKNVEKRNKKRTEKHNKTSRKLTDNEKIL